jgi:hypothetical protein
MPENLLWPRAYVALPVLCATILASLSTNAESARASDSAESYDCSYLVFQRPNFSYDAGPGGDAGVPFGSGGAREEGVFSGYGAGGPWGAGDWGGSAHLGLEDGGVEVELEDEGRGRDGEEEGGGLHAIASGCELRLEY